MIYIIYYPKGLMDRVTQMKRIQNEALELFTKKILIMAMRLLNME
jgi:hypothetical protein